MFKWSHAELNPVQLVTRWRATDGFQSGRYMCPIHGGKVSALTTVGSHDTLCVQPYLPHATLSTIKLPTFPPSFRKFIILRSCQAAFIVHVCLLNIFSLPLSSPRMLGIDVEQPLHPLCSSSSLLPLLRYSRSNSFTLLCLDMPPFVWLDLQIYANLCDCFTLIESDKHFKMLVF